MAVFVVIDGLGRVWFVGFGICIVIFVFVVDFVNGVYWRYIEYIEVYFLNMG